MANKHLRTAEKGRSARLGLDGGDKNFRPQRKTSMTRNVIEGLNGQLS